MSRKGYTSTEHELLSRRMAAVLDLQVSLADRLKLALLDHDGFASQEEILALREFADVPREELSRARESIGARMLRDASSGRWFCVLPQQELPEPDTYDEGFFDAEKGWYEVEVVEHRVVRGNELRFVHRVLAGERKGDLVQTRVALTERDRGIFFAEMKAWGLGKEFWLSAPPAMGEALERAGEQIVGLRAEVFLEPVWSRSSEPYTRIRPGKIRVLA